MYIQLFVNITSRAWAVPILAHLHAGIPGRQAPLLAATGASRTSFAQSMDHLIKIGVIERNPGYGHPLRPEFRLTPLGVSAAKLAKQICLVSQGDDQDLLRRSWTLPVLASLHTPRYFIEIKQDLSPITDRALSQSLKAMEARNWVCRRVDAASRPPRSQYMAVNTGCTLSEIIASEVNFAS
ncbi:MAG: winged helix-turn-helix transcriptional regulator [Epibacterium sp.]|nr:winged helix-turn-helix transcriptional regulator [Epibacterium sp.]NQX71994.1 winged helix-turn-helix transcriptional regulator [Epibacterium sp.]